VLAKADSILKEFVGESIFKFCSFDTHTEYNYEDIWGHTFWEKLNTKKTKGKFKGVEMKWNVVIPYPKCPLYDTVSGKVNIYFDSILRPGILHPLNFIPEICWKNDSCQFISDEQALIIARRQNLKKGIDSLKATLKYDSETKIFFWEVNQTLRKNEFEWENEIVTIEPNTGVVLKHYWAAHQIQE